MTRHLSRHWGIAALIAVVLAAIAYQWTLGATPGFLINAAGKRISSDSGYNVMTFAPLATDQSRAIVRPSPDLAYASCPFDVSKGPVLVEALPNAAPYWSLSVFDDQTDVAFVRNNRQSGNRPVRIALVKPGVAAPQGFEPVPVRGDRGIALVRILVPDRAGFAALDQARRLSNCRSIAIS
ncbi:MAG: DUF1254 domain-containing protein [Pseudomonadota bacterium]